MSCSLAAVFVLKDGAVELVDDVIQESIKCNVKPGTCVTQGILFNGIIFYDLTLIWLFLLLVL